MRLLATRIVASNFLGRASNRSTMASFLFGFFSSTLSKSVDVREKKATSAPEIRAEHNNKTSKNTKLEISVYVISEINKLGGSGSNGVVLDKLKTEDHRCLRYWVVAHVAVAPEFVQIAAG